MKILITGASGFVGGYLLGELEAHGHDVVLTAPHEYRNAHVCDLKNPEATRQLIERTTPEAVVHLAAMANVQESWKDQMTLIETNVTATAHLCSALMKNRRKTVLLFVSSSLVFDTEQSDAAKSPKGDGALTLDETSPVHPTTPYGASKLAAEKIVKSFADDHLKIYIARPFNHIGPGQSTQHACAAFAQRVVKTPDGGVMPVGNLSSCRDFTDVRDIVRAYRLILEKQPAFDLFVLGSGQALSLKEILEHFIRRSGKKITTRVDPALLRPADPEKFVANPTLAKQQLGWEPRYPIEKTLDEIFDAAQVT